MFAICCPILMGNCLVVWNMLFNGFQCSFYCDLFLKMQEMSSDFHENSMKFFYCKYWACTVWYERLDALIMVLTSIDSIQFSFFFHKTSLYSLNRKKLALARVKFNYKREKKNFALLHLYHNTEKTNKFRIITERMKRRILYVQKIIIFYFIFKKNRKKLIINKIVYQSNGDVNDIFYVLYSNFFKLNILFTYIGEYWREEKIVYIHMKKFLYINIVCYTFFVEESFSGQFEGTSKDI